MAGVRPFLLHAALALFVTAFVGIIVLANRGGGFWGFLNGIPYGDKLGHIVLLGTFSLLLNLVLRGRRAPGRLRRLFAGSVILAVLMTLEELSQGFIPSRSLDFGDWVANLAGIALGDLLARHFLARGAVAA